MNRRQLLPLIATLLSSTAVDVYADTLYKCMDESGVVLYTNQKSGAKNCTVLSRELPVSTVAPPAKPATGTRTVTPGDFPRVDGDTQRGRDSDRRKILEQELSTEQQNLDKARKALAEGEASRLGDEKSYQKYLDRVDELRNGVALHERNIEALKHELANIK
jgi:hypothetical protein